MKPDFQLVAPPLNYVHVMGNGTWRVCYHNAGQNRISMELVARYSHEKKLFYLDGGQVLDTPTFDVYRRQHWPLPHEEGRNSDNLTLGVKSATSPSKTNL
jgi:hypothetical protein